MKTIKIITEVEVDEDFEGNEEDIAMFISGCLDNAPDPEDVDESLKGLSVGITYPANSIQL